ncbi:AbrB family transcriptional regulator [Inquilinus sp. YAF38]|uniref:AbrB family transcriptional regulator n=1 Tax=Inquilinus sp. YAF38 TaxID=3233084 RepID=UPI003F90277B
MVSVNGPALPVLARLPRAGQWAVLLAVSAGIAALLQAAALPAALLLGPMVAGILVGIGGGTIRVPRQPYLGAQAIIGCLIAGAITPAILVSFLRDWPLFLAIVLATLAASSLLGWLMSRWQVLPGTTGVWGSSPGAATAMVLMAEAFGADARLVAFMQYLRVVCVATAASLIARFWVDAGDAGPAAIVWFPPIDAGAFAATLALAGLGAAAGRRLRIPAGPMLVPLVVGAVLHGTGLIEIELPEWLLALAYALIGWNIGLGFTRSVLVHAARALPQILLSILALIAFCSGLAYVLVRTLGVDPLTAYLATSPGGMDSIAIIAASSDVDLPFVMALQTVRFSLVVLLGPAVARFIARRSPHAS